MRPAAIEPCPVFWQSCIMHTLLGLRENSFFFSGEDRACCVVLPDGTRGSLLLPPCVVEAIRGMRRQPTRVSSLTHSVSQVIIRDSLCGGGGGGGGGGGVVLWFILSFSHRLAVCCVLGRCCQPIECSMPIGSSCGGIGICSTDGGGGSPPFSSSSIMLFDLCCLFRDCTKGATILCGGLSPRDMIVGE